MVAQAADPEANIIFGAVIDPRLENEVKITVIATGFDLNVRQTRPSAEPERTPVGAPVRTAAPTIEEDLDIPDFLK